MKILSKNIIAETRDTRIVRTEVYAPDIAANYKPGQFIILMLSEKGERVPLTVVGVDRQKRSITLIFQEAGYSTKMLGRMGAGESLYSLLGPLGHPAPIRSCGKTIIVGGGVGIAEILPVARALKEAGNTVVSILGARSKELLILRDEVKACSDRLYLVTDDGSIGEKGFVSDILSCILKEDGNFQLVYCVGPIPMMRIVSEITRPFGIKTTVCLNAIMLDGTGMCGTCRLTEGGHSKFCCVDGPEFDGHLVDFDELAQRQKRFLEQEKQAMGKLKL